MSDIPAGIASNMAVTATARRLAATKWFETALTVLCTAAAVLFVSFLAVVTGLV